MSNKLEIEPLSESRMARIEDAVVDRLRRTPIYGHAAEPERRVRWKPAAALVLAGAAAAVLGGIGLRGVFAVSPVAAVPSAVLVQPSRVSAGHAGSHVDVGDSALDLGPDTEALVSGDDAHGVLLYLERGSVELEVAPRQGRPPFVVRAGEVSVRVIGTRFRVSRSEASAAVDVTHGVVEAVAPGETVQLHAGDHWSWPHVQAPVAPPPEPPVSAPAAAPNPVPVPAVQPTGSKAPSPMDRYNDGALLEGRHPEQALAIYRDLASGSGPWAMNALFAEGRLEADRGDVAEAKRLLSDYLSRYPQGPNADDARRLLERVH